MHAKWLSCAACCRCAPHDWIKKPKVCIHITHHAWALRLFLSYAVSCSMEKKAKVCIHITHDTPHITHYTPVPWALWLFLSYAVRCPVVERNQTFHIPNASRMRHELFDCVSLPNTTLIRLDLNFLGRAPQAAAPPADAADLGGAWLLSFPCLALIRGQDNRLT